MFLMYTLGNAWVWQSLEKHLLCGSGMFFIVGSSGCGKTYYVRQICNSHPVDAYFIDGCSCVNGKELRDILTKQTTTSIINSLSQQQKRKCIVIDELETFLQYDRSIISVLEEFTSTRIPIVCIGQKSVEKKLQNSKLFTEIYVCSAPQETDIILWLKEYTKGSITCERILHIAEACNGNIHCAIQMLNDTTISSKKQDAAITFQDIYTDIQRDQIAKLLAEDPWLNPLKFHENLPKDLMQRRMTKTERTRFYYDALSRILDWDLMMKDGNDPMYALENIVGIISNLHTFPVKQANACELNEFTKLFSNLSLQKKNEKKMYSLESQFPWIHAQIFCDYIRYK